MLAEIANAIRFALGGLAAIVVALALTLATPVNYGSPNLNWKEPAERMETVSFAPSVIVGIK